MKALLLDVGNVIIGVDFEAVARHWAKAAGRNPDQLTSRFVLEESYEQHERGEIDWASYRARLSAQLDVTLEEAQWTEGWNAIFTGPMPGIEAVLAALPRELPVFGFSNTNAVHRDYFLHRFASCFTRFERLFCSHELGRRKPEGEAFERVIAEIGLPAGEILFFDDSSLNIEAARRAGLVAERSQNTGELIAGLRAHGIEV